MQGDLLEQTKNAICASLSKLNPQDSFNIIAFNGETDSFSSSMELASQEAIINVTHWLGNLVAGGETNIFLPLKQVCGICRSELLVFLQSAILTLLTSLILIFFF